MPNYCAWILFTGLSFIYNSKRLIVGVVPEQTVQVQETVQGLPRCLDAEAAIQHGHAQFLSTQSQRRTTARSVSPRLQSRRKYPDCTQL